MYEWDGERLAMMFQRGGPVYCVPVDTVARENAKLLKKKPNKSEMATPRKPFDEF